MLFAIILIVAGILAASGLIIKSKPNAAELIAKLVPFQGIIGVILLVLGIIHMIQVLPVLGPLFHAVPLVGIITLLTVILEILLGFLLGYGLINKFVLSKNPAAAERGAVMERKLINFQAPLGILAIIIGFLALLGSLGILGRGSM